MVSKSLNMLADYDITVDAVICPICMHSLSLSTTDQPFNCATHRGHLKCVAQYYVTFCHRSCPYRCVSRCQSDAGKCTVCRRTNDSELQTLTAVARRRLRRLYTALVGRPAGSYAEYFEYLEQNVNESDLEYVLGILDELRSDRSMLV